MINPEQDSKWECKDCGNVWYDDFTILHLECPKCQSKNIEED